MLHLGVSSISITHDLEIDHTSHQCAVYDSIKNALNYRSPELAVIIPSLHFYCFTPYELQLSPTARPRSRSPPRY